MMMKIIIDKVTQFLLAEVDKRKGRMEIYSKDCAKWVNDNHPKYRLKAMVNGVEVDATIVLEKK